jgi:hypothetical protein
MPARKSTLEKRLAEGDASAFSECVYLMSSRDAWNQEEGFALLRRYCTLYVNELIALLRERNLCDYWVFELVEATNSPETIPVLLDSLAITDHRSECTSCRTYAVWSLQKLLKLYGTNDARRVLWEMSERKFDEDDDENFVELRRRLIDLGDLIDPARSTRSDPR